MRLVTLSVRAPAAMRACALLAAFCTVSSVTVLRRTPKIQTNILEELPSLFIPCNLTDIVTISAPVVNNDTLYYLYSPNNDVTKLDITMPKKQTNKENVATHDSIKLSSRNNSFIFSNQWNATYSVTNVNYGRTVDSKTKDVFVEESNEFVIGPVAQEDHGNWVLSVYYKENGSWVEMFQVITIQITEHVPISSSSKSLHVGGAMEIEFAYPLPDIEICELIVPTPVDQPGIHFREYSRTYLATCRYFIPNLTIQDAGTWHIIGVGKIVYEGRVFVDLNNTRLTNKKITSTATSSSERKKFLKHLMLPTYILGQILKMYY